MWYFQFLSLVSSGSIFFFIQILWTTSCQWRFSYLRYKSEFKKPLAEISVSANIVLQIWGAKFFFTQTEMYPYNYFFVVIVRVLLTQWYLLRWFSYIMQKIKKIKALVQNLILKPLQKVKKIRPNPCAGGPEVWRQTTAERNSGRQPIFYIT